jgi:hypothetical protein
MDLGNKKGPVGRWDFDTPEEYSEYMSTREALPKAAFQYGELRRKIRLIESIAKYRLKKFFLFIDSRSLETVFHIFRR